MRYPVKNNECLIPLVSCKGSLIKEFCYAISEVTYRHIRFSLISTVNFYYIINKLIILVSDLH
jgi:hypothetical protein